MTLTERFLRAKHWQLFLLIFGIPFGCYMIFAVLMVSRLTTSSNPDPTVMFSYFKFFPLIMILFGGTLFGWYWSIATGLQSKVPANVKMKVKKFKIFFFIPVVYLLLFSVLISFAMSSLPMAANDSGEPDMQVLGMIGGLMIIIVPLHFFSIFCIFYCMYFVAKTLKTVELQREVTFSDFAGEFCLLWFYFVGIWIIQPRVNHIVEGEIRRESETLDGF